MKPSEHAALLRQAFERRVLVLDGAMGTMIQRHHLDEVAFRGDRFRAHPRDVSGDNDLLVLTRPDLIGGIHEEYLAAGADLVETCTFTATRLPSARVAPCTCASDAAAIGCSSKLANSSSGGAPSSSSTRAAIAANGTGGTRSCRRDSAST